jgi:hypothetical protein
MLQACSASRGPDEARLGAEGGAPSASGRSGEASWQQNSRFDADGPAGAAPRATYRGGRDPVSGRAQEWAPAAPPQPVPTQSAALPPLPPAAPAPSPYSYQQAAPRAPQPAYPPYGAGAQQSPYGAGAQPSPHGAGAPPISYGAGAPGPQAAAGGNTIEVRQGDTLYRIGRAYGVTVPALMQANNLPNEAIRPGQRLVIPGR